MSTEGAYLVLDLQYVRRLVQLSTDRALYATDFTTQEVQRLITARQVLDRLIESEIARQGVSRETEDDSGET